MNDEQLRKELKKLFDIPLFAALATCETSQPYLSLVAFTAADDLKSVLFTTARSTSKYRNISANAGVALLVDNLSNDARDIRDAIAATVIGTAREVTSEDHELSLGTYVTKHPQMKEFVLSSSTLLKVQVQMYYVVQSFQNITILSMTS